MGETTERERSKTGGTARILTAGSDAATYLTNWLRAVTALFRKQGNIYKLFFTLVKRLNKLFSITTAVLIVHSPGKGGLKVIAVKKPKYSGEGLALTLPDKDSFLYPIFKSKATYTDNSPESIRGNFVERKLLFDEQTKSIAVCPVKYNGESSGLICLASSTENAFKPLEDGYLDGVMEQFGLAVVKEKAHLNI